MKGLIFKRQLSRLSEYQVKVEGTECMGCSRENGERGIPCTAGGSGVGATFGRLIWRSPSQFKMNVICDSCLDFLKFFKSGKPRLTGRILMKVMKNISF